jgi:hypothetical protein
LCHTLSEIFDAITTITANNALYDYLILAQEYIPFLAEYRLIVVHNRLALAYTKQHVWKNISQHGPTMIDPQSELFMQLSEFVEQLTVHKSFVWA